MVNKSTYSTRVILRSVLLVGDSSQDCERLIQGIKPHFQCQMDTFVTDASCSTFSVLAGYDLVIIDTDSSGFPKLDFCKQLNHLIIWLLLML